MTDRIINGAPMVLSLGAEDVTRRLALKQPIPTPQHFPKQYIFAADGTSESEPCTSAKAVLLYGAETFNVKGPYHNHSTNHAKGMVAKGNTIMYQRVIPDDAGPRANLTVYADVLPTDIPVYLRTEDGSLQLDSFEEPIQKTVTVGGTVTPVTTPGFKIKFIREVTTTKTSDTDPMAVGFGQRSQKTGSQSAPGIVMVATPRVDGNGDPVLDPFTGLQYIDQVPTSGTVTSVMYPIYEQEVPFQTSKGNNRGHRLTPISGSSNSTFIEKFIATNRALPYSMQALQRATPTSSATVLKTLFGEQEVIVSFKKDAVDPISGASLYAADAFVQSYQNLLDARYEIVHGPFKTMHVYQENIDSLLERFHAAEVPHITLSPDIANNIPANYDKYDFTSDPEDKYLFNMFTGKTTKGYTYNSLIFANDGVDVIQFGASTNIYCGGGSDGTMNNETFDELVIRQMNRYLDPSDPVQNAAWHNESIFYDSGLGVEAKLSLLNAMALRKDVKVVLGTYVDGEPVLTIAQEIARATMLRTAARFFPESTYFGTPTCRAEIYPYSGLIRGSDYQKRVPTTYDIGSIFAGYMGSSDGKWKTSGDPEGQYEGGNIVRTMYDIRHVWIPDMTRVRYWDIGLNFVLTEDRETFFWPAYKTVYDDDSSPLNNSLNTMALCTLNKKAQAVWRAFTGVSKFTNPQFLRKINDHFSKSVEGIFDGRYTITPEATKTEADLRRRFSWTLPVKMLCRDTNTVMTTYVQVLAESDTEA